MEIRAFPLTSEAIQLRYNATANVLEVFDEEEYHFFHLGSDGVTKVDEPRPASYVSLLGGRILRMTGPLMLLILDESDTELAHRAEMIGGGYQVNYELKRVRFSIAAKLRSSQGESFLLAVLERRGRG